jgi:pimeloyl-ACP methyl ester carboxylesterase
MTSTGFEDARTATVNGTTLAYREQGEGEPVVFVHGAISDLRTWEQQLPAFGRSYRAIAYSRRFARPNQDIDPGVDDPWLPHVEDLAAFVREIDAAPAHLVGNSYGAILSLLTAVRHPDVVRSLVIEEAPVVSLFVSWPPRPAELLRHIATRPRAAITVLKYVTGNLVRAQRAFQRGEDDKAMRIFCHGVLGEERCERLPEARKVQIRDNLSTLRAACVYGAGFPPLGDDEVRSVRAPALLVIGERSPCVFFRLTDRLEELLPIVERVEIPGASHLMHEDNAPALNEAIVEFLKRQRDGQTSPPVA